jgi:hypothetical protein
MFIERLLERVIPTPKSKSNRTRKLLALRVAGVASLVLGVVVGGLGVGFAHGLSTLDFALLFSAVGVLDVVSVSLLARSIFLGKVLDKDLRYVELQKDLRYVELQIEEPPVPPGSPPNTDV